VKRTVALTATLALALVAAGGVGAGILPAPTTSAEAPTSSPGPAARPTAKVERQTLAERETLTGSLGYPPARPLTSGLAGTLTRLPAEGKVITRGQTTVEIDGRSGGILLYGSRPAWRDLGPGSPPGADIRQLKENLRALGFLKGKSALDASWDKATTAAVKRWQRHLHVKVTGRVALGSVVFRPGPVRVGAHRAELGDAVGPGTPVYDATGDAQQITADLKADRRRLVHVGDPVNILLPGGARTTGTIRSIGAVAHASPDGSSTTISLEIALDDASVAAGYDQATVSIEITTQVARDVLAVPVTALVALRGGGYAVEVVRGGTTELVRVEPGMFADGYVEVTATGLDDASHLERRYPGVRFVPGDGRSLPFEDRSFDIVHASAVIEHVGTRADQARFLAELWRVARVGIMLTTPNRWFPVELHTSLPVLHWLPSQIYRWVLRRIGLDFHAEVSNLNLLSRRDATKLGRAAGIPVDVRAVRLAGWPSNLVVIARRPATA